MDQHAHVHPRGSGVLDPPGRRTGALTAGQQIGQYELIAEVGRGGMGVVWKAFQPSLDREVAIKFLPVMLAQHETSRERFRREARLVARLRHPHVMTVFDFGEQDDYLYLVCELVGGGTLDGLLKREGRLSPARAVAVFQPVADALDHLHRNDIVHRDVKPSNVLLREDGAPVLADCGVARLLHDANQMTAAGSVVGTPVYMSPEQAAGLEATPRSDLYSLGIMLYEALTGSVPFEGRTPISTALAHLREAPPPLRARVPGLAPEVEAVVLHALAKRSEDRFPSGRELMVALDRAAGGRSTSAPAAATSAPAAGAPTRGPVSTAPFPPSPSTPAPQSPPRVTRPAPAISTLHPRRRRRWIAWLVGAALALLTLGLVAAPALRWQPGLAVAARRLGQPAAPPAAEKRSRPIPELPDGASPPSRAPGVLTLPTPRPAAPQEALVVPTLVPIPTVPAANPEALADDPVVLWAREEPKVAELRATDKPAAFRKLDGFLRRFPGFGPAVRQLFDLALELAAQAMGERRYQDALDLFVRARELRPEEQRLAAELQRAELWISFEQSAATEQWEAAISALESILQVAPGDAEASQKLEELKAALAATAEPEPTPAPAEPAAADAAPAPTARPSRPAGAAAPTATPVPSGPAPTPAPEKKDDSGITLPFPFGPRQSEPTAQAQPTPQPTQAAKPTPQPTQAAKPTPQPTPRPTPAAKPTPQPTRSASPGGQTAPKPTATTKY